MPKKPKPRVVNRRSLALIFNAQISSVAGWSRFKCPKVGRNRWDIYDVAEWVCVNDHFGPKGKIRLRAKAVLAQELNIDDFEVDDKGIKISEGGLRAGEKKETSKPTKQKVKINKAAEEELVEGEKNPANADDVAASGFSQEDGIVGMISRLRFAEKQVANQYQQAAVETPLTSIEFIKAWRSISDLLVKAEKELDQILARRKAVVNIDEAMEYFYAKTVPVKQQFKSLGADLCLQLAASDNPKEVKKMINMRVREILGGLTK